MVTGSLKPLFEREGLGLIPLEAGARLVVEELETARTGPVEIVVLADPTPAEASPLEATPEPGDSGRPRTASW